MFPLLLPYYVVSPRWLILSGPRRGAYPAGGRWKKDPVTVYFARLFSVRSPQVSRIDTTDAWYLMAARDEYGNSNDTIFSTRRQGAAFDSVIRNFCIWRIGDYYHSISLCSASFASYHLPRALHTATAIHTRFNSAGARLGILHFFTFSFFHRFIPANQCLDIAKRSTMLIIGQSPCS